MGGDIGGGDKGWGGAFALGDLQRQDAMQYKECIALSDEQSLDQLLTTYLMNGVKEREEEVRVVVGVLALDDRGDPLEAHSSVNVFLGQTLQLSIRLPGWFRVCVWGGLRGWMCGCVCRVQGAC